MNIKPSRWILLLTVGLGILLNPLNSSMISVALTQMQHEYGLGFADASWLISIFYLASAVGQPVMGKLSDMFGAKRLFLAGLIIVALSCILAPFSINYGMLLGCRALQAIGSSTLFPSGMSMVRAQITRRQGQAIAIVSLFSSTSAAFGPTIGGFLVAEWNWPAIFLINLPIIAGAFILAVIVLPKAGNISVDLKRIDIFGMILFTASVLGLILFLLSLSDNIHWWALAFFITFGVLFYLFEKRKQDAFIDVESLRLNKHVNTIYVLFMLINFVNYNYFFGLPTMLQQVRGYSEENTGIIMLALAGFSVIATPIAGRIIDKKSSKLAIVLGTILFLAGTGLMLTYAESTSLISLLLMMSILGISNGFCNIASQTALYEHVDEKDTGSASGLFQTSRYLGAILSGSFLGTSFDNYLDMEHFHLVVLISFIFCSIIVFLSFALPKREVTRIQDN